MTCRTGHDPEPQGDSASQEALFTALLEDSAEDLYENGPCGYLSILLDGEIAKVNDRLLSWIGYTREESVGRMRFADLLTVGGKLYYETHFAPLLRMQGEVNGIAFDLKTAAGARLPVLVSAVIKRGSDGQPLLIRIILLDARDRRSYERELLRARREAEADRERLQDALATLQRSLLPTSLPKVPGLEAAAHYHTAHPDHLGGDFYDLFPLGDGRWAFFLGDVCGKGPAAAAVTSLTRYTLRAAAIHNPDPAAALSTLNTVLYQQYTNDEARYCTVIYGLLTADEDAGFHVTLASGGHPSALLLRADGTADYQHTPGGLLIGILPTAPVSVTTAELKPGETLLLYTDGVLEARTSPSRELFGDEALLAFATDLAPATADTAIRAMTDLLADFGDGLDDDTAVLALSVPHPASTLQKPT